MSTVAPETTKMPEAGAADGTERGGVSAEVAAYVGLVRAALKDLAPEDLDDLTGGLEADLAELAAESEEPLISRLGEPSAYAAELRAAAGFPPPDPVVAEPKERWWRRAHTSASAWWAAVRAEHPWVEKLRPVWWLLRGVVLAYLVWALLGYQLGWVFLLLGAALSFWVGLMQDGWEGWRSRTVLIANVIAAIWFIPVMSLAPHFNQWAYSSGSTTIVEVPTDGVFVEGEEVVNLFVYDGAGQRIDGARVFTDQGTPLLVQPWMVPGVQDWGVSSFDSFPIEAGQLRGWLGNPTDSTWVPPVLIGPAAGFEPTDAESTPEPTAEPTGEETSSEDDSSEESAEEPTSVATATP